MQNLKKHLYVTKVYAIEFLPELGTVVCVLPLYYQLFPLQFSDTLLSVILHI